MSYLCILLEDGLRKKRHIALHVLGRFKKKTVLNKNDIFYFIYSILYWYILVSLYHARTLKSMHSGNKESQSKAL